MANTNRATKPAPTIKDTAKKTEAKLTEETKDVIAQAGHNQPPENGAIKTADDHLRAALKKAKLTTDKVEKNSIPLIATAVVEYLKAKSEQKLSNKAQVSVTLSEMRKHCYDLVGYARTDPENPTIDTSSSSFEHAVTRGIQAGMLVFEQHKSFTIDDKQGIVAPSNLLAPKLRVKNPATSKWDEIDNPTMQAVSVPIRTLEQEWKDKYGKEDKRKPRQASSEDTTDVSEMNMSQLLTAAAKLMHSLADKGYPLSEGQLDNLVNIQRDIEIVLAQEDNAKRLGLADAA